MWLPCGVKLLILVAKMVVIVMIIFIFFAHSVRRILPTLQGRGDDGYLCFPLETEAPRSWVMNPPVPESEAVFLTTPLRCLPTRGKEGPERLTNLPGLPGKALRGSPQQTLN